MCEEVADIVSYLHGNLVYRSERFHAVAFVAFDDTDDFFRVYFDNRYTDTVARFIDGNFPTIGRVQWLIYIVHATQLFGIMVVQLDNYFFGKRAESRCGAYTGP